MKSSRKEEIKAFVREIWPQDISTEQLLQRVSDRFKLPVDRICDVIAEMER